MAHSPAVYTCTGVNLDVAALTAGIDDGVVWNQLAVAGEYHGHQNGSFRFDRAVFEKIIANFQRNPDNTRADGGVVVDWEHASEADPAKLAHGGAPAAGFIRALAIRGNELWAAIKWLSKAREQVKTGEYKRISPVVAFKSADPKTGENIGPELRSAGLTNGPFLQGMQPLAARRDGGQAATLSRLGTNALGVIRTALQAHPMATLDSLAGHLDGLREMVSRSGGLAAVDGVDIGAPMASLRALANVPITCSDDDVLDIVEDLLDEALDVVAGDAVDEADPAAQMTREPPAAAPTQTPTASSVATKETTMTEAEITALSAKCTALETENTALKAERASGLTAQATNVQLSTKVSTTEAENATLKAENASLRASQEKRDLADVERDVDDAISDHGGKNAFLCTANRQALIAMRKATPEAFATLAPKVAPSERTLLTRSVPDRERAAPSAGRARIATAVELAHKMIKDEPARYGALDFDDVRDAASEILMSNPLGIAV